jgi:hypothetical protein
MGIGKPMQRGKKVGSVNFQDSPSHKLPIKNVLMKMKSEGF